SNFRCSRRLLPRQVERFVIRQDAMRCVADLEVAVDLHAEPAQALDFFEEGVRIDHHPVAEETELAGVEDAGGDQPQRKVLVAEANGVAGVVAALITCDHVEGLTEEIDNFSLAFVAPLHTNDGEILSLSSHERRDSLQYKRYADAEANH